MKVFLVIMVENQNYEHLIKVFSNELKAQAYIDDVKKFDPNDFEIQEWEFE